MSEIASDTTVTESAPPTTTADAAAQVIDAFDQAETNDVEVSGDTPEPAAEPTTTTPAAAAAPPAEPAKALSDEEQLLAEFGFKEAFKPDGREHYIARSKVLKMIGSGLKRGQEKWTSERTTLEGERTRYKADLEEMYADIRGEPKALLEKLAGVDPRYRAFLEPPAAPAAPPPADAEMPVPDYALPDGSRTYSLDGIQKQLIPWLTQAITKQLEAKVDERLKPITEREQADKTRQQRERLEADTQTRLRSTLDEAQRWPHFGPLAADGSLNDVQKAVLAELKKDSEAAAGARRRPSLSLEGAYLRVMGPKLADRESLIREMQKAPKSTSVSRTSTDTPRTPGPATTQDVAARALARLERGGS